MQENDDRMDAIWMRARDAGLEMDEERLAAIAEAWPGVEAMLASLEAVKVNPLDLALETFDPAWTDLGRRR